MANATPSRRPLRKPKAEHLCMAYPDWLETSHPNFWLSAYLIDLAEQVAMKALYDKLNTTKGPKVDRITEMAANSASIQLWDKMAQSARHTRDSGLLLYAWPGTTFFDAGTQHQ
ncbi:hypothetical protein DR66_5979 [Delftia acidovorans]|uniref:hypothetical protein n=1 Tax=Delftia acidovorans TaxID=80866 RepID=UPI000508978C|nr:hypothetical protein [Delftia acidovorans]KFJ08506.1 hypothetical protein DR66_5979 [Delftia acidovorans]QQB48355.1 hypothetical protein I6H54_18405 [Delftia acidovorans]